jgi:tetratricopeptide (TPR) repeat protein
MEFIPLMKLDRRSVGVGEPDPNAAINQERVIALSSWMMILGTIRAICTFADLASAFLKTSRVDSVSWQMLSRFIEDNQPFLALGVVWPLLLAIIVQRTRWPELVPAAGVTFLILSIGGLLETVAEWNHASGQGITFGSFHLSRVAFVKPSVSDVVLAVLGTGQLVVECATGLRCLLLYRQLRASTAQAHESNKQEGARRARLGRLAIYTSVGFLILMIRLPVWSTYLEIINESKFVREFVLKTDPGGANRPRRGTRLSKAEEARRGLQQMLSAAFVSNNTGDFVAAKEAYLSLLSQGESAGEMQRLGESSPLIAQVENNLAWLLATCPKAEIRDSQQAVKHAQVAVEIEPSTGNYWNTLGVALYRNGEWDAAYDALGRSMKLRDDGGDSFDWFFLAMIDYKQGRKEKARELYEKAVQWYHLQPAPNDDELYRFQLEAAEQLGLSKPTPRPGAAERTKITGPLRRPGGAIFPKPGMRVSPAQLKFQTEKERTLLPE